VSYGTVDQLPDISDTQARAFFEPVAPLVDRLLLQYFRADVSVTLDRKYAFLDSRRFAPLVAVERRPEGRWPGTAPFAAKPSETGRRNALSNRDAAKKPGARPIVGVVELSIQRDEDVTSKLPVPGEASLGLPAATTPWADGAGEGGDLERWAARRAARRRSSSSNEKKTSPRAGRWLGGAPADEYAYVSCMCVKDEFRRRGCADALMAAAEEVTRRWGYDCAALHVYQKNEAAVRLYERRGYEIVDDRCGVVDKIMGKQRFLMVKRLR
jgi:ribosomal protein S18 acetylase RimI-like enzyme